MSTTMCGYCGEFEAAPESKLTRVACAVCALRHERASSILDAIKAAMKMMPQKIADRSRRALL